MPKRFTDSEKWKDPWFRSLSPTGKLLFLYLCDQCDLAGFWEIDIEQAAFHIRRPRKSIEGALEEVARCYETNGTYLWITRFIRFQGNFPFKKKNPACQRIISLLKGRESFSENITRLLNGKDLPTSYEGSNKGLFAPLSNGIGKGLGNSKGQGQKIVSYSKGFEKSWAIWISLGRAVDKIGAYANWLACLKGRNGKKAHGPATEAELLTAAKHYQEECITEGTKPQFVMHAATFWGSGQRWKDYVEKREHRSAVDKYADTVLEEARGKEDQRES